MVDRLELESEESGNSPIVPFTPKPNVEIVDPNTPPDCVAVGDLFKLGGSKGGRKNWNLRRFYLHAHYLSYFDKDTNKQKGKWDLMGCVGRRATEEDLTNTIHTAFAFVIEGPGKRWLLCASNLDSRDTWIRGVNEASYEYSAELRQFMRKGEVILADQVIRRCGMLGMMTTVRVAITNFPKLMIVDVKGTILKEQRVWDRSQPPTFTTINNKRWKILITGREYIFEDEEHGSIFWSDLFLRFPDVSVFVPHTEPPRDMDFVEVHDKDTILEPSEPEPEEELIASMEIGDLELSASNLKMLQGALGNVKELVTAISSKIIAIDEEIDWELEAKDPEYAAAAAADRQNRKVQLQILKDNVAVISANLESLVAKSIEIGITNIDMDPVENVINETSAMLVMLNFDEQSTGPPILSSNYENEEKNETNANESPRLENGEIVELKITSNNFDASDVHVRPDGWADVRLKRVLLLEVCDHFEGISPQEIATRRMQRVSQVETEMVQEVLNFGRVLNANALKPMLRVDCDYIHSVSSSALSVQHASPDLFDKIIRAAVLVTSENYNSQDPEVRPPGWKAVRMRRVLLKESSSGLDEVTLATTRAARIKEEEELMMEEVRVHGQVFITSEMTMVVMNEVKELTSMSTASALEILKEERVLDMVVYSFSKFEIVQERTDRMKGIDEATISDKHEERERQEEERLKAEVVGRDVSEVLARASVATRDRNRSMTLSSFISAANQTLENLSNQVVDSLELGNNKSTKSNTSSASVLSFVPRDQQKVNLKDAKVGLKRVVMKDDLKQLDINAENFDLNDPRKRPPGWQQVRLRRVQKIEEEERFRGLKEVDIMAKRAIREIEEEQNMIEEVSVSGRIKLFNMKKSAPLFPKTFYSVYSAVKTGAAPEKPVPLPAKKLVGSGSTRSFMRPPPQVSSPATSVLSSSLNRPNPLSYRASTSATTSRRDSSGVEAAGSYGSSGRGTELFGSRKDSPLTSPVGSPFGSTENTLKSASRSPTGSA